MSLREFLKLLRNRWITITGFTVVMILGAVVYTLLQTPMYKASTRLYVSTMSAASASEMYQGNRLSQDRVLSYTQLLMGETLAQRTIDRLDLSMNAGDLKERVTAKSKPGTILIDVSVLDESPVRARDIANALSEEFVVMVRELETPSQGEKPEARVVVEQRASVPKYPVVPQKARNLAAGAVLGIVLGVGMGFVRDLLDNTVKTPEELEELTGSGVVGYVPFDKTIQIGPTRSFDNTNSTTAEAFRKIRTNLQFLAVDHPPRLIVVTSSSPNEGKSTTALNIALVLAEAENNVVLVDADLRRPSLAKRLDMVGSVGLSNALSGATELAATLQESKFPRLTLLAAGPTPPNPSELLGSLTAQKVLAELRSQFDYVIIDSPPLLAVTDGAILAAHADGALFTVRAGTTKREHLEHAVGLLNQVGATLLGTILNMIPTRGGGAYSYNYHYYGGNYKEADSQ